MLLLLHLAVWWDFGSSKSHSLLLAHAGVFLIWQPFLRLEKRFGLKDTVLFSLASIGLAYWLDPDARSRGASRETYQVDRRATSEHAPKQMGCTVTFAELP